MFFCKAACNCFRGDLHALFRGGDEVKLLRSVAFSSLLMTMERPPKC